MNKFIWLLIIYFVMMIITKIIHIKLGSDRQYQHYLQQQKYDDFWAVRNEVEDEEM